MIDSNANRFTRAFGEYAPEFDRAADATDDPEAADAYDVLAALARGESPPNRAAQRLVERAQEET